ncbi:MAG TPA: MBL fold metallo-hydrolase [Vicinamibacterales bacterium]|nr:MBL fold metallo-hydrolase [Vicinamibacterales bacterium]
MFRRCATAVAFVALLSSTTIAQDAKTVLANVTKAMGSDRVRSIRYSGTGWNAAVGQSFAPTDDWPRFDITSITRTIDYDAKTSYEDLTRRQGNNVPRGGGGTPLQGDQRAITVVSGTYAWNVNGTTVAPQPAAAELRQLDIWLSPHGFLKAAAAAPDLTATPMTLEGRKMTILSYTLNNKYRVNGHITDQNLVERVQTWVANPVFGDMVYEHRYTDYKDYNGVKFPGVLHSHQGDPSIFPGHNWMEVRPTTVQVNAPAAAVTVTDAVRAASVPPVRTESTQLAQGVWLIAGGSHNSVLVEFRDFVAVVEAPQNETRSLAVIAEVERLVPGKAIQYVVNTHHHFDHSGGLRTYVAQGATVITHEQNRDLYERVFFYPAPRTLQPDRLSMLNPWFAGNRTRSIQTLTTKYTVSDGVRTMDVHPVQGLDHNSNMLVVYLPTEKMLINADLYSPQVPGQPAPTVNPSITTLNNNIQRLKLDVTRHVPIHGIVGPHADFVKIVGAPSSN